MVIDCESKDLNELEKLLLDAKEVLRYLEMTYPTFDPKIALLGSDMLSRSAAFLDNDIIRHSRDNFRFLRLLSTYNGTMWALLRSVIFSPSESPSACGSVTSSIGLLCPTSSAGLRRSVVCDTLYGGMLCRQYKAARLWSALAPPCSVWSRLFLSVGGTCSQVPERTQSHSS